MPCSKNDYNYLQRSLNDNHFNSACFKHCIDVTRANDLLHYYHIQHLVHQQETRSGNEEEHILLSISSVQSQDECCSPCFITTLLREVSLLNSNK